MEAKHPTLLELSNAQIPFHKESAAFVLIDYQNEYTSEGNLPLANIDRAIGETKKLLAFVRECNLPVIHIVHDGGKGGIFDLSTHNGQIVSALQPRDGEPVFKKSRPNSFYQTELDAFLKEKGKTSLLVAGLMSHMCLSTSIRAGFDLDYQITTVASTTTTRPLNAPDGTSLSGEQITQVVLAELRDRFASVIETVGEFAARTGA